MGDSHRALSGRERQIIDLASKGHTDREIAEQLGISEGTVATYWERIRAKMGPHHRSELVVQATLEVADSEIDRLRSLCSELEMRLQQMEDVNHHLRCLFECAPDPLMALGPNLEVIDFNAAAEALFGYRREEALGRSIREFADPRDGETILLRLRAKLSKGGGPCDQGFGVLAVSASGTRFLARLESSSCFDDGDRILICAFQRVGPEADRFAQASG